MRVARWPPMASAPWAAGSLLYTIERLFAIRRNRIRIRILNIAHDVCRGINHTAFSDCRCVCVFFAIEPIGSSSSDEIDSRIGSRTPFERHGFLTNHPKVVMHFQCTVILCVWQDDGRR